MVVGGSPMAVRRWRRSRNKRRALDPSHSAFPLEITAAAPDGQPPTNGPGQHTLTRTYSPCPRGECKHTKGPEEGP